MWNAIKTDLLDFVTTIKEDTAKVISKASGEVDEEKELFSMRQKQLQDVKRSFDTYGTPIEDQHSKEFEKYMRSFSLSSHAADIALLLDEEVDVSRYYADLVPISISPELFWARYFFRLVLVSRGGVVNLDDEDEEDMTWESGDNSSTPQPGLPGEIKGAGGGGKVSAELVMRNKQLEEENAQLKGHIRTLVSRVAELEAAAASASVANVDVGINVATATPNPPPLLPTSAPALASASATVPAPTPTPAAVPAPAPIPSSPSVAPGSGDAEASPSSPEASDIVIVSKQAVGGESLANLDEDEEEDWG